MDQALDTIVRQELTKFITTLTTNNKKMEYVAVCCFIYQLRQSNQRILNTLEVLLGILTTDFITLINTLKRNAA